MFTLTAKYGVFASAGRRLMALAKAIPPPILDFGGIPRTPNREQVRVVML